MAKRSVANAGQRTEPTQNKAIARLEFSGPLPPPGMLEAYDRVVPGAAERLLAMAEKEQRSVHTMRHGTLMSGLLGQILSAVVLLILVVGGIWLLIIGSTLVGTSLLAVTALLGILARNISPQPKK